MGDPFDNLLSHRVGAYASTANDSDWLDVRRRARQLVPIWRRRRTVVIAATLVVAVGLLAAPGWGLRSSVVDLFTGEPAPPELQRVASGVGVIGAPREVVGEKTRKLLTTTLSDGRQLTLWVAPSESGGVCLLTQITPQSGGAKCGPAEAPTDRVESDIRGIGEFDHTVLIVGRVPDGTHRLELEFGDRAIADLALTKGFFVYEVPMAQHARGARPSAFTAYDGVGNEIAHTALFPDQDEVYGVYLGGPHPPG
jgi:hypothetical protein